VADDVTLFALIKIEKQIRLYLRAHRPGAIDDA
jgi:hypothetical protein